MLIKIFTVNVQIFLWATVDLAFQFVEVYV